MPGESGEGVRELERDDLASTSSAPTGAASSARFARGALRLADDAGRPGPALALRARRHAGDQRVPGAGDPRLRRARARAARGSPASTSARASRRRCACGRRRRCSRARRPPTSSCERRDVPAGTQVVIVNTFNHRDRERVPDADRFAPEEWIEGEAATDPVLQPLQPRPAGLPGHRDRDRRRRGAPRLAARPLRAGRTSPPGSTWRSCRTCSTSSRSASASSRGADPAQARRPSRSARSASPVRRLAAS